MTYRVKYASKGEIVTCENSHKVAVFNQDVYEDQFSNPNVLDYENSIKIPKNGEKYSRCLCHCGSRYVQSNDIGGTILHFKEGWRSKYPYRP